MAIDPPAKTTPMLALEFEKPVYQLERQIADLINVQEQKGVDFAVEIANLRQSLSALLRKTYAALTPWEIVQVARHPARPQTRDYLDMIVKDFDELHGDRKFGDDKTIVTGMGRIGGHKVMIVGHHKGRDTKEKIARNFGMPQPEGYRKGLRLMKMAEKFGLPLLSFIDTPGAYPGIESEARHVSEAIAVNLREMAMLRTPSIAVIVGEGGSGGALGIGVTDRVLIFENSYYSVISPEGCAAILWKDGTAAPKAAEALKLNAASLKPLGVVDEVIAEPLGGAHYNPEQAATALKSALQKHLSELCGLDLPQLLETRYQRYRKLGVYEEAGSVR